jgi:hypothetical protein
LLQLLLGGVIRILRGLNTEPLLCSKPTQYRVDESHGSLFGGAMPHVPRDLSLYDRKWPPADGDLTFSFISISDQDRRPTRI